jgi:Holliday junction resolvasome RuvABC DNA-binding subunit
MFKKRNLLDELSDYFKKNLKKGYTKESLKWALVNQGYSRMEIEKAIKKAESDLAASAPILKTKPEIKYEIVTDLKPEKEKKSFWKKFFKD